MTEPTPPSPPPTTPPPAAPPPGPPTKKGLSPLAWVGIGCGALALIAVVVIAIVVGMAAKKGKEYLAGFEENPAMAAAETMIRLNPELELVESDRESGTLTVRSKETGEVVTFNLEEIEQGKLSVLTEDGEEASVTFRGGEGGLEIESEEGGTTSRLRIGADPDEIPSWVPVYPGAEPSSTFLSSTGEGTQGAFSLNTDDSPDDVLSWYSDEIEDLGMETQRSTFDTPGSRGGLVAGEAGTREIHATVANQGEGTLVTVTFTERR